jgi:hypothetical protein
MHMLSIRGRHNGRAALIPAAIIDAARYRRHRDAAAPVLSGVVAYRALIDTGATSTMISMRVMEEMALEPVTKIPFHSLDGITYRQACLFNVALYDGMRLDDIGRDRPSASRIHICTKLVTGGVLDTGASFDVLIGMDIISTWTLTFSKDGAFEVVL